MIGYKYDTEQQAQAAIDSINAHCGIPFSEDAVTRTYTNYVYDALGFYYFGHDENIEAVLGAPIDFELTPHENDDFI